jgi:hypothetical protein
MTFSDAVMLLKAAGRDTGSFAGLLGAMTPIDLVHILMDYTTSFVGGLSKGEMGGALLQGG